MTKYINLFAQQTAHQTALQFVTHARYIAIRFAIVLTIIALVEVAAYVSIQNLSGTVVTTQKEYEAFVNSNKVLDSKLRVFLLKNSSLHTFMKDDTGVSEKYYLVKSLISQMGDGIVLDSFSLDVNQNVTFGLRFASYDAALVFLTSIEHTSFLTYFEDLELKQFTIKRALGEVNILEFSGVFKPIHETINN